MIHFNELKPISNVPYLTIYFNVKDLLNSNNEYSTYSRLRRAYLTRLPARLVKIRIQRVLRKTSFV